MMGERSFSLIPFAPSGLAGEFRLTGRLVRQGDKVSIFYELSGPLKKLAIPATAEVAARRHGLWQYTCFELFGRVAGQTAYWEVNLSLAGHWNIYSFQDYRQGMEEAVVSFSPLVRQKTKNSLAIGFELDLDGLSGPGQPLEVAVAGVLLPAPGGEPIYWALDHPAPQPDFHHPAGFLVQL